MDDLDLDLDFSETGRAAGPVTSPLRPAPPSTPPSTPLSLPERMYLLCHDLDRDRPGDDTALVRGPLLRAAAVAELRLAGQLDDHDGRAARGAGAPGDAFLAEVLDTVPVDGTERWYGVVDARWWAAEASVREGLAARGVLSVSRRRWLGMIPHSHVTPTDPAGLRALRDRVRRVVLEEDPVDAVTAAGVLAMIAVDGGVCTVFAVRELREHRAAVRALGERVDEALPGLREALVWAVAARRSAASV